MDLRKQWIFVNAVAIACGAGGIEGNCFLAFPPLVEAAVGCSAHTAQGLNHLAGIRDAP